jgi:hypothetical protein
MMGWPTDPHGLWLELRAGKVAETLVAYWCCGIPRLVLRVAPQVNGAECRSC